MNTVTLRPLQHDLVNSTHAMIRRGMRRICCVAPTGFGKRYVSVWWAKECELQWRRAMIVTDRKILVGQMRDELANFGVSYGVLMGSEPENRDAPIQVASIHTLRSRGWLDDTSQLPQCNVGFIDECHKELDAYAKLMAAFPNIPWIGLTATPVGPNGKTLITESLYEGMVEGAKNSRLIKDGFLLPTTVIAPSEPDIEGVAVNGGEEFNQTQLSKKVWSVTTFANVFDEWAPFADRQTIVFAPGVPYCRSLLEEFNHRGIPAAIVDSETRGKEREDVFRKFASRDVKILLSVDVLKEGFDAPIASCAIDLQPNSQLRTYWQKVGRIKRTHESQSEAVYIDMAGNCWRHMLHPDEDPDWNSVTGEETTAAVALKNFANKKEPDLIICPKCKEQRRGGPKCRCGHECPKPVRWIRMENGKLKEIPAERIIKKEKSQQEIEAAAWKSALFRGLKSRSTVDQCRYFFKEKKGYWPPDNLPCMPERGSIERKMKVPELFSAQDIVVRFSMSKERAK